jgi:hypothetical protein
MLRLFIAVYEEYDGAVSGKSPYAIFEYRRSMEA